MKKLLFLTIEYGGFGGAHVDYSLRSGTNEFHGALWEYFGNDKLNARNAFALSTPFLRQNQFGAMAAGPGGIITCPHLELLHGIHRWHKAGEVVKTYVDIGPVNRVLIRCWGGPMETVSVQTNPEREVKQNLARTACERSSFDTVRTPTWCVPRSRHWRGLP
jgi:hypothetical protein